MHIHKETPSLENQQILLAKANFAAAEREVVRRKYYNTIYKNSKGNDLTKLQCHSFLRIFMYEKN